MVNSSLVSTCIVTVKWTVICQKPKAEAKNWSVRHWQIIIFFDNQVQWYCFIIQWPSLFFDKYLREAAIFTKEQSQKREKGQVSFMHEQNIICSQSQ